MSMDIIFYTACVLSLPADLPDSKAWKNYGGTDWAYETEKWQVIVDIDKDFEIPEEAMKIKNDLDVTIPITLEPIGADEEAYNFLEKTTQQILSKCGGGVLEDPSGLNAV